MTYVLIVIFLGLGVDGSVVSTKFTVEYPDRQTCLEVLSETETKLRARENFRALTVECRPKTMLDEPMTAKAFETEYLSERLVSN